MRLRFPVVAVFMLGAVSLLGRHLPLAIESGLDSVIFDMPSAFHCIIRAPMFM